MSNCPVCGRQTVLEKDGKEIYLPCLCVWERGFHERLKKTVGSPYWTKTLSDWNPPVFKQLNSFPELMEIQKFVAISRLWSFCFKDCVINGKKTPSLNNSIHTNRNLFIRGPAGSGRGLLCSTVKMLAAMKDISTTELPSEFDIFKTEVFEASSLSKSGEDAKLVVYRKYIDPALVVLENMRAESRKNENSLFQKKFRSADFIDAIFAKRQGQQGSLLITSLDFLGDIGDYYGERIIEELSSEKTMMIILLHPKEANSFRLGLMGRHKALCSILSNYDKTAEEKSKDKRRIDKQSQAEDMALIEEGLYFEEAFEEIPIPEGEVRSTQSMQGLFSTGYDLPYERQIVEIYNRFEANKKEQNAVYVRGVQQAIINGIKACKELATLMTDKECHEIGKMISLASRKDKTKIEEIRQKTSEWVLVISGKKDKNAS